MTAMAPPFDRPELEILERLASLEARVGPARRNYPADLLRSQTAPGPRSQTPNEPATTASPSPGRRRDVEDRLAALEVRAGIRGARP